jgi:hypothetical protein
MNHSSIRISMASAAALVVVSLHTRPALAVTSYASVSLFNNTNCTLAIPTGDTTLEGAWNPSTPPTQVNPHQTISWETRSDGLLQGTSGSIQIEMPTVGVAGTPNDDQISGRYGTAYWDVPYGYFNPSFWPSHASTNAYFQGGMNNNGNPIPNGAGGYGGGELYTLTQSVVGCSGNSGDTCTFSFVIEFNSNARVPTTNCTSVTDSGTLPITPTGALQQLGVLTSYFDTAHNSEYVFYSDSDTNIDVLSCGSSGCWKSATAVPAGSYSPGSSLISYYDGTNGHLFFQGSMGSTDLVELKGNPPSTQGGVATDVTSATNPANGGPGGHFYVAGSQSALAPTSNLTGYWDGKNDHVFYEDNLLNVHETYYNGSWWDHIVAPNTAPSSYPPTGVLRSLWDGTNEHVYYTTGVFGSDLAESSFPSGNWSPSVTYSGLGLNFVVTSFLPSDGYEIVYHQPATGEVASIYNYDVGGWNPINTLANSNFNYLAPMLAYGESFFAIGTNQHVYFYANFGGTAVDLTTSPGNDGALAAAYTASGQSIDAKLPTMYSPLSGFFDGTNNHVFFIDTTNNVQEIYWSPGSSSYTEHVIGGAGRALPTAVFAFVSQ